MKLATFHDAETTNWGLVQRSGVQLAPDSVRSRWPGLRELLAAGAMQQASSLLADAPLRSLSAIRFSALLPQPSRILCVGVNYLAHIQEMGRKVPDFPTVFTRHPDTLVGHGESIVRPHISTAFDYEGELAVVIGKAGRYIKAGEALDHVAGYTCLLDGSVRDWQMHTTQFTPGKNFPATGSCGPWLVTVDEIPDPSRLHLQTRVNGEVVQEAPLSDLCFDVRRIIEYCSSFCTLRPGDIIATGTPSGVGYARKPQRWLTPGDLVEVEISQIGVLRNEVVDEATVKGEI
ncbi:MAG: fumarylacetoacetate hydrolase family protein [Gammaproteobacteria bacterium]